MPIDPKTEQILKSPAETLFEQLSALPVRALGAVDEALVTAVQTEAGLALLLLLHPQGSPHAFAALLPGPVAPAVARALAAVLSGRTAMLRVAPQTGGAGAFEPSGKLARESAPRVLGADGRPVGPRWVIPGGGSSPGDNGGPSA